MDREEFLRRIRESNYDEHEERVSFESNQIGWTTAMILINLFTVWNVIFDKDNSELTFVFSIAMTAQSIYQYRKLHQKKYLIILVTCVLAIAVTAAKEIVKVLH